MPARMQSPPREEVLDVDTPSVFLTCAPGTLPPEDRKSIGPAGDRLQSGDNELNIPRSAVPVARPFTFEQEPRDRVGVTVNRQVPPVHFATSAILFIDFSRCRDSDIGNVDWHVWRMDSTGLRGQKLRTWLAGRRAMTFIDGTSVYMIAN
ncbi:MAG: hypothetical protein ACREK1_13565 [Longimicrobiales bacterium]